VGQPTPDQALARLIAGNRRFVKGTLSGASAVVERRTDVAHRQKPFAMALACADSRVPVEHVFDQSVGDIFVCRVAGNILAPSILGSLEFAASAFGSAALVVLCHERCGAIESTLALLENGGTAPGSIQSIVDAIEPAVRATKRGSLSEEEYVDAVIRTNARLVARALAQQSAILRKAVRAGELKIVPAHYDLDSGRVTLLA
jgi:carbonic anhydrase